MNIELIHQAFECVVNERGIYHKLKIPKNNVAQYRWKLKRGIHITIDKKLSVLQKAGYRLEVFEYSDHDLIEVIKFTIKSGQVAKELGPEYILSKYKSLQNKGK